MCLPALEDAVAPYLPAIRAALRDLDITGRPSATEIIERIRANGLEDPFRRLPGDGTGPL